MCALVGILCEIVTLAHGYEQDKVIFIVAPCILTLRLLMPYIYGAPSKARNANVVYIWTYVWQR